MLRRDFLTQAAALGLAACLPRWVQAGATEPGTRLAAAWQQGSQHQVGILIAGQDSLTVATAIDVPTRAHALLAMDNGDLLAVARRPGHWLLRWSARGEALEWKWIEPGRAFTGHAVQRGDALYIAETDLDTGAGLIGVRDARTLEKRAEWPTHGIDPHQILFDAGGHLMVANGGVPTRPESGRAKVNLDRMDSSLVRLDGKTGALLCQWRLPDTRLSLRHMAWNGSTLGIALQAEHDDPTAKFQAPVLAMFDGQSLCTTESGGVGQSLAGYGGDIAATVDGFAVSCPRVQRVQLFNAKGELQSPISLEEACALTATGDKVWAGGRDRSQVFSSMGRTILKTPGPGLRMDNHWIALPT